MSNRITDGIANAKEAIQGQIDKGVLTQEALDKLGRQLDMDTGMYCDFQNRKSIASMNGKLSLDEAQTIYMLIGESPSTFNALPVHTKVVLTHVYKELF